MEFSEAQTQWRSIPDWASCLIEFGYAWMGQPRDSRMIAVISMPSDSAAAGLVALGAMRRCLELENANDTNSHYEKLLELAKNDRLMWNSVIAIGMAGSFLIASTGRESCGLRS